MHRATSYPARVVPSSGLNKRDFKGKLMNTETAIEKILIHLTETRGQWSVLTAGAIRRRGQMRDLQCPITSLAGGTYTIIQTRAACRELGFPESARHRIVAAADKIYTNNDALALRAQMLAAAGLEETE